MNLICLCYLIVDRAAFRLARGEQRLPRLGLIMANERGTRNPRHLIWLMPATATPLKTPKSSKSSKSSKSPKWNMYIYFNDWNATGIRVVCHRTKCGLWTRFWSNLPVTWTQWLNYDIFRFFRAAGVEWSLVSGHGDLWQPKLNIQKFVS